MLCIIFVTVIYKYIEGCSPTMIHSYLLVGHRVPVATVCAQFVLPLKEAYDSIVHVCCATQTRPLKCDRPSKKYTA